MLCARHALKNGMAAKMQNSGMEGPRISIMQSRESHPHDLLFGTGQTPSQDSELSNSFCHTNIKF